ncbi:hypothetical protein CVIRNUC_006789 [Coccomyxa viridis]|uniref:Cytochrome P450 n=1 Tax=Coccomyxa viridis TaxID=1274662 RepID=A0AAV1IC27_9CHLO|nr:hypothetical protein CVIRNUC_006789 [Coccomyxa viridis]
MHAVVVTDPYLVSEVLSKETEIEKSIEGVYSKFNVLLHAEGKPNIFTSHTNDYWKLVRKGVAPAFSSKNIRKGFGHVVQVNHQLISILDDSSSAEINLDNATLRVTLDVIGRVGFGKDFGATRDLSSGKANLAFDMMEAGQPLPDDRIAAEIGVFFTGGFETTGHTIAWTLFMISVHPEVEARVLAELRALQLMPSAKRPQPRAMEYDDMARLTYTSNAIKEAMRMLPVLADGTNRTTTADTRLGPYTIPKGTMVWVPLMGLFNSPRNWADPDKYMPDRWEDPLAEYALPRDADAYEGEGQGRVKRFLPFSLGTRDCVGQSLARMNTTTTVAMLLARFKFQLADKMGGKEGVLKSQSVALSTLQPEGGLWAHCIPRSLKGSQTGVHQMAANGLPGMPRPSSSGQLEPLPEHPDASCTLDAPHLPSMNRQRSGALPAHLALAKGDILPAKPGSKLGRSLPSRRD